MPAITFDEFDRGLDLTKGPAVAGANRLRDLKNAYIAPGQNVQKRPGSRKVAELSGGTVGLAGFDGKLHTFSAVSDPTHGDTADGIVIENHQLPYSSDAMDEASIVHFAEAFNGALYVSVEYVSENVEHHYITGGAPFHVADVNCPHTKAVQKLQSKIYAIDGETVPFSVTDDATDWTTPSDAGFLPTGLRATGQANALALGEFNAQLVVLMQDSAQIWAVDPDPSASALSKTIGNIGTNYPNSVHKVAEDLYFLAPVGYRSIAVQQLTQNFVDLDVGVPIDPLVRPLLSPSINPISTWYAGGGQYWSAIGSTVHVYTFSRTNKISAWSYYEYPWNIDAFAQLGEDLYYRSGDDLYIVDDSVFSDDGSLYEAVALFPYLDCKKPGISKTFQAIDSVGLGSCFLSHLWNSRDVSKVTAEVTMTKDTRPLPLIPVEVTTTEIAPKFRNYDALDWRLDAFTYYYSVNTPL